MPRFAQRMPFLIKADVIRGIFGRLCTAIDIDESIHIPMFQQFISWDIVVGRVKADIFRSKTKRMTSEIIDCIQKIQAVMAAGFRKLKHEWKFHFFQIIPVREHVEGVAKIPGFLVAVPSPSGIGIRIVAAAVFAERTGRAAG